MTEQEYNDISDLFYEKKSMEKLLKELDKYGYAYVVSGSTKDGVQIVGDPLKVLKSAISKRIEELNIKIERL